MRKTTSFLMALLAFLAFPVLQAKPQTLTVLYSFAGGTDGGNPFAGLVIDKDGNLYGTTVQGGDLACSSGFGCGTVFKLDKTGRETVLYSFTDVPDGSLPLAGLVRDKEGNLYGTTADGGSGNCYGSIGTLVGCGTVFELDKTGNESVLYSFRDTPDGSEPVAGLVMDKEGNLYGTAKAGGSSSFGIVFKIDATGKETVLHSFSGIDGGIPEAGLVMDKERTLYGTTVAGGSSIFGTVFKLDTIDKETVLHSFINVPDGGSPKAGLVMDKEGNLYGTTFEGGASGYGAVFKVDRSRKETVLHSFSGLDGAIPFAGLVMDRKGNFYGTTGYGGASFRPPNSIGAGTVFKVDTTGTESVLHSFSGMDGAGPQAGLVMDKEGNLYGTTAFGGTYDYGTVFKLTLNCEQMHQCEGHSGQ